MKLDDITKISHKSYNNDRKNKNYLKNLITRLLLSIILFICTAICIKFDDRNIKYINDYVFTDSIKFTKINNWYQDKIGTLIPKVESNDKMVFSSEDIKKNNYEKYLDGVKIEEVKDNPISIIYGGIVVFIGEKEGYNNTLIIQGNDGIDYWYGNIKNINVNLYDYLEKDTLVGEANDDYIYLVLEKEGKFLDYEEYLKN